MKNEFRSPSRYWIILWLGSAQILAWGTTYYLPAVLARSIAQDTGWPLPMIVGGLSWSLLIAGLASPRIGRMIDKYGGRGILASSSLLLSTGLALIGLAPNLVVYYFAWAILGLGMAAGLYDAAFATLNRYYGGSARAAITGITLIAGFASTIGWPVLSALNESFGWRSTCLIAAAGHLFIGFPIYRFFLPSVRPEPVINIVPNILSPGTSSERYDLRFVLLAMAFTLYAFVISGLSVHILTILQELRLSPTQAVAIGALIGPSQVGARVIEFFIGRYAHPLIVARCASFFSCFGIALLSILGPGGAFIGMILYGGGNGLMTIARGAVPLALFGPQGYGGRIGLIARPMLAAQALAPIVLADLLQNFGVTFCLVMDAGAVFLASLLLFIIPACAAYREKPRSRLQKNEGSG